MARYEHLSIYKAAFDLNVYIEQIVRHFSRYHKYTLGTELRERARRLPQLIRRANNQYDQEKLDVLYELREELEQMKLTVHLCKELKVFHNFNSFQTTVNQIVNISKQNEGWIKSLSTQDKGQGLNSDE